ncbi:MAG TPA: hypothetical protein PK720_03940 [bacterium]|jgi:uncharacterized protein YlxW (UPF0749 family)|nr:hypothetical protein [bacterium]
MKKLLNKKRKKASAIFEKGAFAFISRIGSIGSIIIHSLVFIGFFLMGIFGYNWNTLLLILTTIVSLEAIYLAIFIQMTVNQNTQSLAEVEEDIDEIQKDIDDIQEDVDEIQEDVDDIAEEEKEAETHERLQVQTLAQIQTELQQLARTIATLRPPQKK